MTENGTVAGNMEKAIFDYNRSQEYVLEVKMYAHLYVVEGFIPIEFIYLFASGFARPVSGTVETS